MTRLAIFARPQTAATRNGSLGRFATLFMINGNRDSILPHRALAPATGFLLCVATTCFSSLAAAAPQAVGTPDGKIIYNRDIRPILSDNCFHCHGNDKNHIKAKLRMDLRDVAVEKEAIVPGKPDASGAVQRIYSDDPDEIMPPPDSHKKLTAAQKALIKRWVAEGAEYQPHWAYIAPERSPAPAVKDAAWVRNPIDAFILARLEAAKLKPSPEADRRTLLRRLSLDLVGLPPTPQEVDSFLQDERPDAYERQVDRLLASPHFGERMAVPWLDAVRFADTVGFHGDQNQNVFPYRDYVINAFNANKPFDQFTIEQIAGDLLPNPTPEQLVATGFNRLNMMTREGGAQAKEYLAKYQADRVRTVSLAFLGSTFGCAECHDHKFDPISTKDFYSMSAFFADVRQWGVYSDYGYTPNPELKGYNNEYPFPPEIRVKSPYLEARRAKLSAELAESRTAAAEHLDQTAYEGWLGHVAVFAADFEDGWMTPPVTTVAKAAPMKKTSKAKAKPKVDAQKDSVGEQGKKDAEKPKQPADAVPVAVETSSSDFLTLGGAANDLTWACDADDAGWVAALRFEIAGDRQAPTDPAAKESTVRLTARLQPAKGDARSIGIRYAEADLKSPRYDSTAEVIGVQGGWKLSSAHAEQRQTSVWLLDPPVKLAAGDKLVVSVAGAVPSPARLSVSPLADWEVGASVTSPSVTSPSLAALIGVNTASLPDRQTVLRQAFVQATATDSATYEKLNALEQQVRDCRDGMAWTQVTVSTAPMTIRVLPRGNWQDESGEVVRPATPHFLPPLPDSEGRSLNRLDLAKWIVSDQNPLTGRTIANRTWKMFFGAGLCASIEDLGAQGEWPSHPELLDWLAVEFEKPALDNAPRWDVKHLVRLMVTSSAYRQQSNLSPAVREFDPSNRLLSAQSPIRLEAEFVRDNALFAAGLLNLADIGGPSNKPYQPEGYYAALQFPDRNYVAESDERQYRRGVYAHRQRTFLHPMLANFDAPSREDSVCTRVVSNTPQQALTLLNDPQFVEASRVLAARALAGGGSDADRLERVFQWSLCRSPKAGESESLLQFLASQRTVYKASPEDAKKLLSVGFAKQPEGDAAELAAWTNTARVVLNLHEMITRY